MMINILFILLFLVFPFGQILKWPINAEINIYLQDIIVGIIGLIWGIGQIGRFGFVRRALTKPILLFMGAGIISFLINWSNFSNWENLTASLYLLRWVAYAGVAFAIINIKNINFIKKIKIGLILAGMAAAVFGLLQYFFYPDLRNLAYFGWDPHKFRAFGTFFDPNFLGIIMVLTIILIIDREISIISIISLISVYLVLALTYSRSSYLAFIVGIGIICLIRKTPKLFAVAVLIGILTLLLLPKPQGSVGVDLGREDTIASRINNWKQSLIIAKDRPLFGSGFNAYRYAQKDYGFLKEENSHAGAGGDSSLLFVFATTGIVGTIAYLYLIYDILIYHIRRQDYIVVASLSVVVIHSFFNNTLFYPPVMLWMWILVGSGTCHSEAKA